MYENTTQLLLKTDFNLHLVRGNPCTLYTPSPTLNSFNIVMTLNADDDDGDQQMIMIVVMILGYHSGTTKHFHFFYKGHTSTP